MAKHTISPDHRHPCGQKRRKSAAQRQNDANRAAADAVTELVRMQPHRRPFGDQASSPLAASPLGRFVLRHKLRSEFYDAAEDWAKAYRKWINSQPGSQRLPGDGGDGGDVPYELIHQWAQEWVDGDRAMRAHGSADGALSVWRMAIHWEEFAPGASVRCCVMALVGLAYQRGRIDKILFEKLTG